MSGSIRRILNLGLFEGVKRAYSLRRLNLELSKVKFFHPTAQEAAAHGKVLPTLTPAQFEATSRTRICNTDLATAEAAAPKIDPPKTELVIKPPEVSYSIRSPRCVHFLPTASESKSPGTPATSIPCQASTGTRRRRWPSPSLPRTYTSLTAKTQATSTSSIASSIPTRRTYARSSRPWCGGGSPRPSRLTGSGTATSSRCPRGSPPTGRTSVYGHALVGDTICFSISGSEGHGTYCFHMATREWSKAGDWLMPFHGKADYVPELGLWFGVADDLPCAADLSGVVEGEEPPPKKMRIWVHDDLPEEWQPSQLFKPRVISLGSGKFMVVDFLDDMQFDKESNEMYVDKQFALFTGMEVAYSNGNGKGKNSRNGAIKNNDHSSGKGKGLIRGLRMIKHKSGRYLFNNQQRIEEVL
uniref:Uncharacterized protein n=1 Tax=Aegilops tauschii TaxID=37682 RepID=M8C0C5_AEGTA